MGSCRGVRAGVGLASTLVAQGAVIARLGSLWDFANHPKLPIARRCCKSIVAHAQAWRRSPCLTPRVTHELPQRSLPLAARLAQNRYETVGGDTFRYNGGAVGTEE